MVLYKNTIFGGFAMKKVILILLFSFLLPLSIFAAPFGLTMGMSLDDLAEACDGTEPKHIENDCYYVFPVKKHPLFKHYVAFVDSDKGLYCIKAISDDIQTNNYGSEIQNAFAEIKERVSKTYGKPRMIDEIASDSLWKEDKYWVSALADGARTYACIWESSSKNKLKDDLTDVSIYASAQRVPQIGWIILEYDFNNMQAVKDAQDDVF